MKLPVWIIAALSVCLLAGCTATDQTSFRHQPLTSSRSSLTAIDAKQRVIIAAQTKATETVTSTGSSQVVSTVSEGFRFCAEPSPDVFSVVAQAISGGGNFGQGADPKVIEAALNAAFSSSEQGATIPRTQTINMLRELMYRTCERWLNNELGDVEMPIQAARDQRLMVSILAIEQLTGAVTPKPVTIGSASSASAGSSGADATVRIDDAYKALTAKTAVKQARQKDFDALNTGTDSCDALAKKVEAKTPLDEAQTKSNAACDKARTALSDAEKEWGLASGHHRSLIDASRAGGIPASATSSADSQVAAGGIDSARSTDVKDVAVIVQNIVDQNFNQDEFLLFCLKVLNKSDQSAPDAIKTLQADTSGTSAACIEHIKSSIERATAQNQAWTASRLQVQAFYDDDVSKSVDQFMKRVTSEDGTIDKARVSALAAQAKLDPAKVKCLNAAGGKAAFQACFKIMVQHEHEALAGGKD